MLNINAERVPLQQPPDHRPSDKSITISSLRDTWPSANLFPVTDCERARSAIRRICSLRGNVPLLSLARAVLSVRRIEIPLRQPGLRSCSRRQRLSTKMHVAVLAGGRCWCTSERRACARRRRISWAWRRTALRNHVLTDGVLSVYRALAATRITRVAISPFCRCVYPGTNVSAPYAGRCLEPISIASWNRDVELRGGKPEITAAAILRRCHVSRRRHAPRLSELASVEGSVPLSRTKDRGRGWRET